MRTRRISEEGLAYIKALEKAWEENRPLSFVDPLSTPKPKKRESRRPGWHKNYRMGPDAKLDYRKD